LGFEKRRTNKVKVSVSTQNEAWMPPKGPSVEACSEMKIRVAWLHPTIPNYRLPLLQRLAQVRQEHMD
jgi:hypothetical protein